MMNPLSNPSDPEEENKFQKLSKSQVRSSSSSFSNNQSNKNQRFNGMDNIQSTYNQDQNADSDVHPHTQSTILRGQFPQSQISSQYASIIHAGGSPAGKESQNSKATSHSQRSNGLSEDFLHQMIINSNKQFSQVLYKGATCRNEVAPYGGKIAKFTGGFYPREVHGLSGGMKKSRTIKSSSNNLSTPYYQTQEDLKEKERLMNMRRVQESKRRLQEKISKKQKQEQMKKKEQERINQQKQRQKLLQARVKKQKQQEQKRKQKEERKLASQKKSMTKLVEQVAQTGKIQQDTTDIGRAIQKTPQIQNYQQMSYYGNQNIIRGQGVISQSESDQEKKEQFYGKKVEINQNNQINYVKDDIYNRVMSEIYHNSNQQNNNAVVELMSAQEQESAPQNYSQQSNNLRYSSNSAEEHDQQQEAMTSPGQYLTSTIQHCNLTPPPLRDTPRLQHTTQTRTVPDLGSSTVNEQVIKAAGTGSGFDLQQFPTINQQRYSRQDILLQLSHQRQIDETLQNDNHQYQSQNKEEEEYEVEEEQDYEDEEKKQQSSTDLQRQILSQQPSSSSSNQNHPI